MRISKLINEAIREDIGSGDITTDAIFPDKKKQAKAEIIAKQFGIVCGIDLVIETFRTLDDTVEIDVHMPNGFEAQTGDILVTIKGSVSSLLKGERTALNFLGRLSGIATLTREYVKRIEHTETKLLDTRKTIPGYRLLEKFAVRIGGGINHRFGLFDAVMIKDNHLEACGSMNTAVQKVKEYAKRMGRRNIKIVVEVKNEEELEEALSLNIEQILLDNMSIEDIKNAVIKNNKRAKLEVSGNIGLDQIKEIAEAGVDYISVGKVTHSANVFDVSMKVSL